MLSAANGGVLVDGTTVAFADVTLSGLPSAGATTFTSSRSAVNAGTTPGASARSLAGTYNERRTGV
jgi:hypothetical protein